MIVTISGNACSGKDSAAEIVSEKMNLKLLKSTMKTLAKENGFDDVLEFEKKHASNSDEWDKMLDEWQKKEASKGNCVLVSMLSGINVPEADLKVFLHAPLEERAKRVSKRDGVAIEKSVEYITNRDTVFKERIQEIYGVDFWEFSHYDLVINTQKWSAEQVSGIIVSAAKLLAGQE
ncbi:MAG: cytidylate kinase family protein [Candidatus Diapherotrites archaeon]|nr:cytidylate kinase family protein [Candidatus Diapherotrites archaeon]